jgi:transcriptional regulator with XRE-family HTH domain
MNTKAEMDYPDEIIKEFAHAIRVYRHVLNITQSEFVEPINIGLSTYSDLESKKWASPRTITLIEQGIGKTVDEILAWHRTNKVFARPPIPEDKEEAS